jgi:hypothetical protein
MMMSLNPSKAHNPFEDWLFINHSIWEQEVISPLQERERTLLKRMEHVFPAESRPHERRLATWLIYEGLERTSDSSRAMAEVDLETEATPADLKTIERVTERFEKLYNLCMRQEERVFTLQLGIEVLMSCTSIPSLSDWWKKLDVLIEQIEIFDYLEAPFHHSLAELLNMYAQYALIEENLDTAHRMHRALKKAGYTYKGAKRNAYLPQWSHVSLMLLETYAHRNNFRNARLLYEDICFIDEELANGHEQVLEDHAKGAELLIWLSRENPSSPKTLQLQRDLFSMAEQHVKNSVMVRHFINGAISMAQSYGNSGQLKPALRLWENAHRFVRDGGHYTHPEVLMLLGKLGMNVIWTHNGKDSLDDVQRVYDQLCEMAANAKGHPVQYFEQCAWAAVNLAWVYAQKSQLENLPQLLHDIHVLEAHYPIIFGFKESAAATIRNGLWGMRHVQQVQHDLVYQCIHHEAKRLIRETQDLHYAEQETDTPSPASPYFLQQLSTLLFQLGQLDIRSGNFEGFAERLAWAETLLRDSAKLVDQHALFLAEFALMGLENRHRLPLMSKQQTFWEVLEATAKQYPHFEPIQRLYAAGCCHRSDVLRKREDTRGLDDILISLMQLHAQFPDAVEITRGICAIHLTLVHTYAETEQWAMAKACVEPLATLFEHHPQDAKILHAWVEALTKLVTSWPNHRTVKATLPYLESLLRLAQLHPNHAFWPGILAKVRAHHCYSFYMIRQEKLAEAEFNSLLGLWNTFKPSITVETCLMQGMAAKTMWYTTQKNALEAEHWVNTMFSQHESQFRERRPVIGWENTLTAALSMFELALQQHAYSLADNVFRRSLHLVQHLNHRKEDPWRTLGFMALGWMRHIEQKSDPRPWYKRVLHHSLHDVLKDLLQQPQTQGIAVWDALRQPHLIPAPVQNEDEALCGAEEQTSTPEIEGTYVVGHVVHRQLGRDTLHALHQDPDPLWIDQKTFEVCVLEGAEEAEAFYQEIKRIRTGEV